MKNYKGIILAAAALILGASACKKYETFPVNQNNIDKAFNPLDSNGVNAQKYLNTVYSYLRNGHNRLNGGDYLDAASDDAVGSAASGTTVAAKLSTGAYNSGTFSSTGNNQDNNDNLWAFYYTAIREANIFITNIPVVPVIDAKDSKGVINGIGVSTRYIWQSEARFLRALYYFELVKRYGGVPLVGDKVFLLTDNIALPRNSFEECVNYIANECDSIQLKLRRAPLTPDQYGEVTQGAALALKARVLLYAASPLFNGGNIDPNNKLTGYTDGKSLLRWQKAADAAAAVIALQTYSLDTKAGPTPGYGFKDVFLTQNNTEVIFERQGNNGTDREGNNAPVGFSQARGTGNESPTQDLVDAFPMNNGLGIGQPGSGYNPVNPYLNRDPRLSYTVFYNGQTWLNTALEIFEGGQSKPNNNQQQTVSGYYLHKFMGNSEKTNTFTSHSEDWVIFRYGAALLDYAEAQNEANGAAGPTSKSTVITTAGLTMSPFTAVTALRARAGLAPDPANTYGLQLPANISQDSMRSAIRNERRIELAFEEQRYFDIRRWKIAKDVMDRPRRGVIIRKNPDVLNAFLYNYTQILPAIYPVNSFSLTSGASDRRYLYPIPYDEVVKNKQMIQNPGW